MAPVSKFAMRVTLDDGTVVWVNRDGITPSIEGIDPSDDLSQALQVYIDELLAVTEELLTREQILEQCVLPDLRIYGASRRRPFFAQGESVTLERVGNDQRNPQELCSASIQSANRP